MSDATIIDSVTGVTLIQEQISTVIIDSVIGKVFIEKETPTIVISGGNQGPQGIQGIPGPSGSSPLISRTNSDSADISKGTPVYAWSATEVRRARTDTEDTALVIGLVSEDLLLSGAAGYFQLDGRFAATISEWEVVTGMVGGLVEGQDYFLDPVYVGKLTTTPPESIGYLTYIGYALSATELYLDIDSPIRL